MDEGSVEDDDETTPSVQRVNVASDGSMGALARHSAQGSHKPTSEHRSSQLE